jgi:hypothetical protein
MFLVVEEPFNFMYFQSMLNSFYFSILVRLNQSHRACISRLLLCVCSSYSNTDE